MNSEVQEFTIGQQITSTVQFRNRTSGALADPTTITWTWRTPSGVETEYVFGTDAEVSQASVGIYVGTIMINEEGLFTSKWRGEGDVIAADEEHVRGARSSLDAPL